MNRAKKILEDIKRQTGGSWYACLNDKCNAWEYSNNLRPKDGMQGLSTACPKCSSKMEATWGHTSIPGGVINTYGLNKGHRLQKFNRSR